MKNKVDLFLDSGAFSAFTQGVTIDIQEYIAFIKEHESLLTVYANLDVIGDPAATWKNQQIMEAAGLHPIPCFHYGEDVKWLQRMLRRGYEYIALGGMVPISTADLIPWLDRVFAEHICGADNMPSVKVHGFGLTSLRLMMRYPWYSVDSTSWVVTGRMGGVYVPRYRAGEYIYDEDSWKIAVSSRSPTQKESGKHITTMRPMDRTAIEAYFDSKGFVLGKSSFRTEASTYELKPGEKWASKVGQLTREVEVIEEVGLCNTYQLRDQLNIMYFLDLEQHLPTWPWAFKMKRIGFGL